MQQWNHGQPQSYTLSPRESSCKQTCGTESWQKWAESCQESPPACQEIGVSSERELCQGCWGPSYAWLL